MLQSYEVVTLVKNGVTVVMSGFVRSCCSEILSIVLEKRFLEMGHQNNLDFYCVSARK